MAEETTEQAAQPTVEESHESETGAPTIESLQAELAKAKAESRKWEERAKKNKDAASRVADLEGEVNEYEQFKAEADATKAELEILKEEKRRFEAVRTIAKEKEVDEELLSMMAGNTEEEITANADALLEKLGSIPKYPNVLDNGGSTTPVVSKESILAIKNKNERFEAIKQNAQLFRK